MVALVEVACAEITAAPTTVTTATSSSYDLHTREEQSLHHRTVWQRQSVKPVHKRLRIALQVPSNMATARK